MEATSGQGGKGDMYRPVDTRTYARNYLKLYGKKCPDCLGTGIVGKDQCQNGFMCRRCDGLGYVEK